MALEPVTEFGVESLLRHLYLVPLIYIIYQLFKWTFEYVRNVYMVNKIGGPPMIPFLGNVLDLTGRRESKIQAFKA